MIHSISAPKNSARKGLKPGCWARSPFPPPAHDRTREGLLAGMRKGEGEEKAVAPRESNRQAAAANQRRFPELRKAKATQQLRSFCFGGNPELGLLCASRSRSPWTGSSCAQGGIQVSFSSLTPPFLSFPFASLIALKVPCHQLGHAS